MNNRKDLADVQLQIPKLIKPKHRPSFTELASSLLGPKGFVVGLFAGLAVVSGAYYFKGESATVAGPTSAQGKTTQSETAHSGTVRSVANNQPVESTIDKSAGPSQSVTLHTAQLSTVENTVTLTGTVQADSLVTVTPSMDGARILEMRVQPGDRVAAGEILAVLDNSILRAQLAQAEAQLAAAQSAINQQTAALTQAQVLQQAANTEAGRYATLYERGAISQQQLGERQVETLTTRQDVASAGAALGTARANIASQMAEISRIQAQLDQTVVAAPVAGTVAEKLTTIGAAASVGSPIYNLIEDSQLMLVVSPSQEQLRQIEVDSSVAISSSDPANPLQLRGQVASIEPTLDPKSRQATVKISLPEAAVAQTGNRLRPGMFLQANLVTTRRRSVMVPAAAVIAQPDGTSVVYTVSDRANEPPKAVANVVTVATSRSATSRPTNDQVQNNQQNKLSADDSQSPEHLVEILAGLTPGSRIVVGGASYLQPGDLVSVISNTAAEETSEGQSFDKVDKGSHEL